MDTKDTILSFDIEIYNDLVEGSTDPIIPSVAAIGTCAEDIEFFYDEPHMSKETACRLVNRMSELEKKGVDIFTWNGTSFDFKVLGLYSGMVYECARLALNHIDGMLLVTFNKGYFLSLDAALKGARLETKLHQVKLKNGEVITDMAGKKAPEMWRNGEFEAVKQYLFMDVLQPLKLFEAITMNRGIVWMSKTGKPMFLQTPPTHVKDLFRLPLPDTSWMTNPKPRSEFVEWMPKNLLEHYDIKV